MGRTRRRVTILVLTLEFLGLLLLVTSIYLFGGQSLSCQPATTPATQDCRLLERRILGLVPLGRAEIPGVRDARVETDAGQAVLVLVSDTDTTRIKAASEQRLEGDAARLRAALSDGQALRLTWSDTLLAVAVGAFGLLWLTLMVLIMREFLGYHTPWWWRILRRT